MNYEIDKSVFGSTWTGPNWFSSMPSICRASSVQGRMALKRRRTNEMFPESEMALPSGSTHAFSIGSRVKWRSLVPTGQIQIAINKSYQRVNRNKMPHGVVAGWVFRIRHNSKQTPNDWWDKFSTFANKSVFAFRFDSRHNLCNLYATNVVCRLRRYRVSLSTIQPNSVFRCRSIEPNVYAIDRSIYLLIFTTTFNLCE